MSLILRGKKDIKIENGDWHLTDAIVTIGKNGIEKIDDGVWRKITNNTMPVKSGGRT